MDEEGLEPSWPFDRNILSVVRVPVSPLVLEARMGIEPMIELLQSSALPLGYLAIF